MRLVHLLYIAPFASLMYVSQVQAFDTTTQGLVKTGYATSQVSTGPFDNKLIMAARDDAAAFIASGGEMRGARLESALHALRQSDAKLHASDLELAQAILVQ
ncbi:conserverd hypothetical protein [Pseudomonas syringae]|uniref:DUF2388 domain-containing protein n=1 Tax=Pseudomonas syringae pv. syringae TaxID=321 RepID=A0AAE5S7S1_PSESY|nr:MULTISPECIES: DUF2388 domain-containing protein [Pseudomonas]MBP1143068.1 uncharacterized protein (TIGR02448 family) [Pseudomonas sp. PvP009]MCF5649833.1 DUF2388 domain-containing protein [Pseudomonas syringae]MDA3136115.1 DUF2388 domain-containing protein [Pseudomonas syringae]POQ04203.1 DUF2388 domain-containing protein [Pseudomonas syringae pv. syringae]RMM58204.1 hypothetical protein ALQ76_03787 [Pseudomonas syringae pv. atrofaciens]